MLQTILFFVVLGYTTIKLIGKAYRFGFLQWVLLLSWSYFAYSYIIYSHSMTGHLQGLAIIGFLIASLSMHFGDKWESSNQSVSYNTKSKKPPVIHDASKYAQNLERTPDLKIRELENELEREREKRQRIETEQYNKELEERMKKEALPKNSNRMDYYNRQANKAYKKEQDELLNLKEKRLREQERLRKLRDENDRY